MLIRLVEDIDMRQAISICVDNYIEVTGRCPSCETAQFLFADITKNDYLLGAFDGPILIGIITAKYNEDNESFTLRNLYVDPERRGRGIGKKLLEEILNIVDANFPKQPTELKVSKKKLYLIDVYEEFGFRATEQGWLAYLFNNFKPMERAPITAHTPFETKLTP